MGFFGEIFESIEDLFGIDHEKKHCHKEKIKHVESGEFFLFYGDDTVEIEVPCDKEVVEVYVNIRDNHGIGCHQVCGGTISKVGYTVGKNSIIFYCDIRSNICRVKWFYTYKK